MLKDYSIYSIYSTSESEIAGIMALNRFQWTLDFYSGIGSSLFYLN